MWTQQQQQQEQAYLRGLPSQHPQQQTLHPGIMGTDDRTHHHHRPTTMDLPVPSNPRASRNMAEKQRRDNLNQNIVDMSRVVPTVVAGLRSAKRMDKISILRLTSAYIKMKWVLGCGEPNFLPPQFNNLNLEDYFGDNIIENGSFMLVVTTTGCIVYVSQKVEQHLGYSWTELVGENLYNFVHPSDHEELARNLTPDEMQVSTSTAKITEATCDNSSSSSEDSTSTRTERPPFSKQRRSFRVRMSQRAVSRRGDTQYEHVHIDGTLRLADACKHLDANGNRGRNREPNYTGNDIILVAIAQLSKNRPITEISIMNADAKTYVTRHLVDGRIIFCDHRVSVVAGYLSEEVSGQNAFSFMHKDDFRWTIIGLRQMYDRAETCGSSCYRLLSKTGQFIYLRTHGCLEFHKDTGTVVSLVCENTLVSEEVGMELIKDMKSRLSPVVHDGSPFGNELSTELESDWFNSLSSLEDPSKLEEIIRLLIKHLSSPPASKERLSPSPVSNTQLAKPDISSQQSLPSTTQALKVAGKKVEPLAIEAKGSRMARQKLKPENIKQEQASVSPTLPSPGAIEEPFDNRQLITHDDVLEQESPVLAENSLAMHELMSQTCTMDDGISGEAMPMLGCLGGIMPDAGVSSSNSEAGLQYNLKRTYSDEDVETVRNKKLCNDVLYVPPSTNAELVPTEFPDCSDVASPSLKNLDPVNFGLPDDGINYQQLNSMVQLTMSNADGEQFDDLQVVKSDPPLSPDKVENADFMKILNNLGLKKPPDEEEAPPMTSDNNQVVSATLRRTHCQLENIIALRESQLNCLARHLNGPACQTRKERLTQLRAEHKKQKQMLDRLQQDHHKIQLM